MAQTLLASVGEGLAEFGFNKKPSGYSYFKPIPGGKAAVHLSLIKHASDFDVTMSVAIRFDVVEELINADERTPSAAIKKKTSTLGVEIGNLTQGRQKRWSVRRPSDVPEAAKAITADFVRYGLPYLNEYSDMNRALGLLSTPSRSVWMHSPFHGDRARRILALAIVLGPEADALSIASQQREYLESISASEVAGFVAFARKQGYDLPAEAKDA